MNAIIKSRLKVDKLSVIHRDGSMLLNGITLHIGQGEAGGLTGGSGSGKSTLLRAIMGILAPACRAHGSIKLEAHTTERLDVMAPKARRALAGTTIGYIPQNPIAAFDSRLRIGVQMEETFRVKLGLSKADARRLSEAALMQVGLTDTARIRLCYPEDLSGGMLQRITVAIVQGLNPAFVLADEPTAMLDEGNRTKIIELLEQRLAYSGLLLVSHDITALQRLCPSVAVLYEGSLVEQESVSRLLSQPSHTWTTSLANRWQTANGIVHSKDEEPRMEVAEA